MAKDKDVIVCGICKASFIWESFTKFMEHKLLHVDANQRINCFLCLKWFSKRNALQIHLERVHAIPQRSTTLHRDATDTMAATSTSARCKPGSGLNEQQLLSINTNNGKLNNSFSSSHLHHYNSGNPLSIQPQRNDSSNVDRILIPGRESSENSNLSVDILTTEDPLIEFPLNSLNYYEDVCCNRLMTSDEITDELVDNEATSPSSNTVTPANNISDFTSIKQNGQTNGKEGSVVMDNLKFAVLSTTSMVGSDKHQMTQSEFGTKHEEAKTKADSDKDIDEKKLKPSADKDKQVIDFHFLLGTTTISGSSMKYERLEFRCLHCSFSSAWRPSLMKHMKIAHSDVLRFHEILDIHASTLTKLSENQSELAKKYKVMKLSEHSKMALQNKARKAKRLARAVEFQDIPGKYTCPVCNKVFNRIRYLRRHQLTHKTQRTYLCDHCGKSFKTRSTLIAHTRSHNTKLYQCPQCDFVSNLTRTIHSHRQLHPNGSVVCDICGAVYTDKSTLKKHMRVHDPNRPFSCSEPNCTWRFKTESLMKAHVKSHSIEGKFLCTFCGYKFRHKHHLQRHISRIHPQELMEASSHVSFNPSSNTAIIESSSFNPNIPLACSEISQKQGLSIHYNENLNNQDILQSSSRIPQESGHDTSTISCMSNGIQMETEETVTEQSNQTDQQNVVQVLSLLNNDGQEIVISLPADISPDILNNSIVNIDTSDVIQDNTSGQIYMIRDSQF